jgi:hypothetical protein
LRGFEIAGVEDEGRKFTERTYFEPDAAHLSGVYDNPKLEDVLLISGII